MTLVFQTQARLKQMGGRKRKKNNNLSGARTRLFLCMYCFSWGRFQANKMPLSFHCLCSSFYLVGNIVSQKKPSSGSCYKKISIAANDNTAAYSNEMIFGCYAFISMSISLRFCSCLYSLRVKPEVRKESFSRSCCEADTKSDKICFLLSCIARIFLSTFN